VIHPAGVGSRGEGHRGVAAHGRRAKAQRNDCLFVRQRHVQPWRPGETNTDALGMDPFPAQRLNVSPMRQEAVYARRGVGCGGHVTFARGAPAGLAFGRQRDVSGSLQGHGRIGGHRTTVLPENWYLFVGLREDARADSLVMWEKCATYSRAKRSLDLHFSAFLRVLRDSAFVSQTVLLDKNRHE